MGKLKFPHLRDFITRYVPCAMFATLLEWAVAPEPSPVLWFFAVIITYIFLSIYIKQGKEEKQRQQGVTTNEHIRSNRT